MSAGTTIVRGRGRAVVTATGTASAMGRIAALMGDQPGLTPLQRRLAGVGRVLAVAAVVLSAIVLVTGLVRGQGAELMVVTAISLVVAAVPESLPAVVTLALALGARRMSARHALIRRLPAVETLGSVTVLGTDKTGTLTQGNMVVRRLWTPDGGDAEIGGSGYGPEGELTRAGRPVDPGQAPDLGRVLTAGALCNDAALRPPDGGQEAWTAVGDPTEAALLAAAAKFGLDPGELRGRFPRVAELPFDSDRKRMTTVHRLPDGGLRVICKGAPEAILAPEFIAGDAATLRRAAERAGELALGGFRVLAVAEASRPDQPPGPGMEQGLRLLGLTAILDPPRPTAAATIASCQAAGITPVLITGDHPATARAIARDLGIIGDGAEVVDCGEVGHAAGFGTARVFARATPEQKLTIIQAHQAAGDVVAMTGDGVNDGPALRRADIGVAMGKRGTEVARQAADLVLADDDLGTVVAAAEEGRRVYANIRRFLLYGLAGGSAEIAVMLIGPLVGLALPLLPAQILWVNLLTHGLPGVALGSEPADPARDAPPAAPAGRERARGGPVAAYRPGRRGHRGRHPRRGAVGACHRQAVAEHGLLRAGHHPARGRPRLPRPPGHAGQPVPALGRGRGSGAPVRRDLPAVPQRPAEDQAADRPRPAGRLRPVHPRVRRDTPGPRRAPGRPLAARRGPPALRRPVTKRIPPANAASGLTRSSQTRWARAALDVQGG